MSPVIHYNEFPLYVCMYVQMYMFAAVYVCMNVRMCVLVPVCSKYMYVYRSILCAYCTCVIVFCTGKRGWFCYPTIWQTEQQLQIRLVNLVSCIFLLEAVEVLTKLDCICIFICPSSSFGEIPPYTVSSFPVSWSVEGAQWNLPL